MKSNFRQRDVRYEFADGHLVRTVTEQTPKGAARTYQHRCTLAAFEKVAHAIDETPADGEGTSQVEIARREFLPFTQASVALEFLKERGIVEVRHRRCHPASSSVHIDAMIEWYALREKPKAD